LGSEVLFTNALQVYGDWLPKVVQLDFTKELNRIANLPVAFANNIILPLANLLSEGLVFIILLAFITFYDFKVFFLLAIILVPIR